MAEPGSSSGSGRAKRARRWAGDEGGEASQTELAMQEALEAEKRIRQRETAHVARIDAIREQHAEEEAALLRRQQAVLTRRIPGFWRTVLADTYPSVRCTAADKAALDAVSGLRVDRAGGESDRFTVRISFGAEVAAFHDRELWYTWPSREASGVGWKEGHAPQPAGGGGASSLSVQASSDAASPPASFFELFAPAAAGAREDAEAAADEEFQLADWLAQVAENPAQAFMGELPFADDDDTEPGDEDGGDGGAADPGSGS